MEQELKLGLVDPHALQALLDVLPEPIAIIAQSNHYFVDEGGVLASTRTMLRVRESRRLDTDAPVRVILTVKRRLQATEGYFVAEEAECDLPSDAWCDVREGRRDLGTLEAEALSTLDIDSPLSCHGVMQNTRHVIPCDGFTLEVDRTELPGGRIDAEVEVETDDPEGARQVVHTHAHAADVRLFPQTLGKYARFLEALAR